MGKHSTSVASVFREAVAPALMDSQGRVQTKAATKELLKLGVPRGSALSTIFTWTDPSDAQGFRFMRSKTPRYKASDKPETIVKKVVSIGNVNYLQLPGGRRVPQKITTFKYRVEKSRQNREAIIQALRELTDRATNTVWGASVIARAFELTGSHTPGLYRHLNSFAPKAKTGYPRKLNAEAIAMINEQEPGGIVPGDGYKYVKQARKTTREYKKRAGMGVVDRVVAQAIYDLMDKSTKTFVPFEVVKLAKTMGVSESATRYALRRLSRKTDPTKRVVNRYIPQQTVRFMMRELGLSLDEINGIEADVQAKVVPPPPPAMDLHAHVDPDPRMVFHKDEVEEQAEGEDALGDAEKMAIAMLTALRLMKQDDKTLPLALAAFATGVFSAVVAVAALVHHWA